MNDKQPDLCAWCHRPQLKADTAADWTVFGGVPIHSSCAAFVVKDILAFTRERLGPRP